MMKNIQREDFCIRLTQTEKKEYSYSLFNSKVTLHKNEYGYSLLKFYDTDIKFFEELLDNLNNPEYLNNAKSYIYDLDSIFSDFKKVFDRNVPFEKIYITTKNIIKNYMFLHKLLEIDFTTVATSNERYQLLVKLLSEDERDLYFNTNLSAKLLQIPNNVPVIGYSPGNDLKGLISIYLCDILARDVSPIKCKSCNRPFFPMGKAIYCNRILRVVDGKKQTCKYLGAYTTYDNSLIHNDIRREYRKVYKRYFARIKLGMLSKEQFKLWSVKARELVKLAEGDKISYDEFQKKITEH